jgi:peptidoglycan/LPS O-acetylase OafA/YrhL
MNFLLPFKRITYSTAYLPEVDGLRFLAIFSVVAIMHTTNFLDEKFYGNQLIPEGYWKQFFLEGGNGVGLFFAISGFILSLPFARWRLQGGPPVSLKRYFLRRVTRLEPPYVIVLLVLFAAQVWVLHMYSAKELLPHLVASVFYVHTLVFHSFSWILPVSWSLEVEVQFYILAPLFCLSFLIRRVWLRRAIYLLIIIGSAFYWFDVWHTVHVFLYLHFFFSGILVADLYSSGRQFFSQRMGAVVGLSALAGFLFLISVHDLAGYVLKTLCIFLLLYTVVTNERMKKIFSAGGLVVIGGMCYSIYLLHFAIISAVGQLLLSLGIKTPGPLLFPVLALLLLLAVLAVSALYFLLVEKPFMKPRGLGKKAPVRFMQEK